MTFQLQDATLADRVTLAEISFLANLDNPYGQLVWRRVSPQERQNGSQARFPHRMLAEGSWMVKLQEADQIIAYAEWILPSALSERMRAEKPLIVSKAERDRFDEDYAATVDEDDWPYGTDREIPNAVSSLMQEGRKLFPEERDYILLDELKTIPEHRRRGAGTKLLKWGLDLADREQLNICLIAMPLGLELYEKHGFKRLHEVSVDLSKYGGNTTFTWVFMLRTPRSV